MNASDYFRKLANSIPDLERTILQDVIAVEAERIHAENFRAEAFIDTPPQKWPDRKKTDRYNKARRALLVLVARLRSKWANPRSLIGRRR